MTCKYHWTGYWQQDSHLLAHCSCDLNSSLILFKKIAKLQVDLAEYGYKFYCYFFLELMVGGLLKHMFLCCSEY